jgi:hypothetical protein
MAAKTTNVCLLKPFTGEYYTPENWQYEPKAKNYFAIISPSPKYLFERSFIKNKTVDDSVIFAKGDFPEGEIVEQKCVHVKGSKSETTFQGFFIIHHQDNGIYGEQISQKEALEFFNCREALPLPTAQPTNKAKNELRVKLGTVVRSLCGRYNPELIGEVLADIIADLLPPVKSEMMNPQTSSSANV